MMKIHSLNCTSFCPALGRIFPSQFPRELVCHCLLLETNKGPVLVDTGVSKSSLENVRRLPWAERFGIGLQGQVLMIPLPGHTAGHFGVAVETDSGWILQCGDSYYDQREFTSSAPLGVRSFLKVSHTDFRLAQENLQQLKALRENHADVKTISAHDKSEFPCC